MRSFKFFKVNIVSFLIPTFLFLSLFGISSAATLVFSPQSGTYEKGAFITVNVLVSSADKTMNAASGVISFNPNLLSVSSISKSGSIVGFWAQEPSFSNTSGRVSFEGVVLPPWYTGSSGKIISIVFKTKAPGTAQLSFTSGSVLAADGVGTDIMLGTGGATFTISDTEYVQPTVTPVKTESASLDITEIKRKDLTDPVAKFTFKVSGKKDIDRYEIQIDNNTVQNWLDDGGHTFVTGPQEGGTHTLLVKAISKDGSFLTSSITFFVEALETPIVKDYPTEILVDDILSIKGTTKYSNIQTVLFVKDENGKIKSYTSKSDKDGNFKINSTERMKEGIYTAWVQVIDERGAKSLPTEAVTISVKQSPFFRIGSLAVSVLAVIIPLIALLLLLIGLLWYAWYRWFIIAKRMKREIREAEDALHKAFDLLKESVQEQVKILEKVKNKRQLTAEEERINHQLKKDLDDAENYIKKEIEDIENLLETEHKKRK